MTHPMLKNLLIDIDLQGDAFANGNDGVEVARILRAIAVAVENDTVAFLNIYGLYDVNGNRCGRLSGTDWEE